MAQTKSVVGTTTDPVETAPGDDPIRKVPKSSESSNPIPTIIWSCFVTTVPIAALTIALLVLTVKHRVGHGDTSNENLSQPFATTDNSAFYVRFNSSILLFLTSWVSSMSTMLSGFLLTLASFPIARQFISDVQGSRFDRLLTPQQLALTLKFFDGSTLGALWAWLTYLCSWKRKDAPQTPPLIGAVCVALLATLMGALVTAGDTWLHLTMTTEDFTQLSPAQTLPSYSFGLTPECLVSNNSLQAQTQIVDGESEICSLSMAVTGAFFRNASTSLGVMNNLSSDAASYLHYGDNSSAPSYAYLGVPTDTAPANQDYTAQTYGASTKCWMMSRACNLEIGTAAQDNFNCTNGTFVGHLYPGGSWAHMFFTDSSMSDNAATSYNSTRNPYYYGLGGMLNQNGGTVPNSTEFMILEHGGYTFVMGCKTTIYDIEYDQINGTIGRFVPTVSNISVSNVFATTMLAPSWLPYIQQSAGTAIFSDTAQQFADKVALAFSQVTVALGAGALETRPALAAQQRETFLVARMPVAPLVTLVVFNFVYVLCGLIFTVLAIIAARGRVPDVQARLSIKGFVLDRFTDTDTEKPVDDQEHNPQFT
ncbi:hypothetical protein BDV25DRAFT_167750 [Aspergillus avenaceus]|uniref:Uncharacterized protein n=1 Tax=Aspergillus avenaceus TaxID=36643 RepID=A0A5N6U6J1_ASPAV|nr:hypothetical protein BDV25DRAFT_167750 [Aspergillus avenaceus]